MSEFSMYVCPECKKSFKVKGNNKKVKCPQCSKDLLDMSISLEDWDILGKDKRNELKEKICNSVAKIVAEEVPVREPKQKSPIDSSLKLVTCPACGREKVSDIATACPGCGLNLKEYFHTTEKPASKSSFFQTMDIEQEKNTNESGAKTIPDKTILAKENMNISRDQELVANSKEKKSKLPKRLFLFVGIGAIAVALIVSAVVFIVLRKEKGLYEGHKWDTSAAEIKEEIENRTGEKADKIDDIFYEHVDDGILGHKGYKGLVCYKMKNNKLNGVIVYVELTSGQNGKDVMIEFTEDFKKRYGEPQNLLEGGLIQMDNTALEWNTEESDIDLVWYEETVIAINYKRK